MFFVRKESINTTLGQQKEFAAAARRDIGFFVGPSVTPGNAVWHYLWPAEKLEASIREHLAAEQAADADLAERVPPSAYIWSQEVAVGEVVGEPMIKPYYDDNDSDWKELAKRLWLERVPAAV